MRLNLIYLVLWFLDQIPSIDQNCPIASNLGSFKNATNLIQNNKFQNLVDSSLHVIIGIREAELINFEKIRKPCHQNEPFVACCEIGWTVFGPDLHLKNKPLTWCNFVCLSDKTLEKKWTYYCTNHSLNDLMTLTMLCLLMTKLYLRSIKIL